MHGGAAFPTFLRRVNALPLGCERNKGAQLKPQCGPTKPAPRTATPRSALIAARRSPRSTGARHAHAAHDDSRSSVRIAQETMDVLLENAKQVASAHREAQRQAALQTDLDMLENAESVATALELEEQEAANKAVEELEAAIRLGVELDEKEEEAEQSRRDEDAETTETLQEIEELEAKREEQRLALIEAADKARRSPRTHRENRARLNRARHRHTVLILCRAGDGRDAGQADRAAGEAGGQAGGAGREARAEADGQGGHERGGAARKGD